LPLWFPFPRGDAEPHLRPARRLTGKAWFLSPQHSLNDYSREPITSLLAVSLPPVISMGAPWIRASRRGQTSLSMVILSGTYQQAIILVKT